jgi:hypothetical protein
MNLPFYRIILLKKNKILMAFEIEQKAFAAIRSLPINLKQSSGNICGVSISSGSGSPDSLLNHLSVKKKQKGTILSDHSLSSYFPFDCFALRELLSGLRFPCSGLTCCV